MDIVSEETHRLLAYIDALNRHGVRPPRQAVNEFAERPSRKFRSEGGVFGALTAKGSILSMIEGQRVATETCCQHLARLSWINEDIERVELTMIGKALLKSLNSPALNDTQADVFEVVLSPDNPFAYAQALGGITSAHRAMLVEPYFRLEQLMDIADFDNIVRVLVGDKLSKRDYELLATGLASLPDGRNLEVRKATDLHDRYLIPGDGGNVLMLGASLGGIGKKVSTMTTQADLASTALRDAHDALWQTAEVIEPKQPTVLPGPSALVEGTVTELSTGDEPDKKTAAKEIKEGA